MDTPRSHAIVSPAGFAVGAQYAAYAGVPDRLPAEVTALSSSLRRALEVPVSLVVTGQPEGDMPWVADGWRREVPGAGVETSRLGLYTSGTTGCPKLRWQGLRSAMDRKRGGSAAERWLLAYAPFRWAGMSVLLHTLRFQAVLVVPDSLRPDAIVAAGIGGRVTHASFTPSLFRRLQLAIDPGRLRQLPLCQVTFGGEAASQEVLDTAQRLWPGARVTQVYASTEFGDILSVSDGLAGVPVDKFERHRIALDAAGQLWIEGQPSGDLWRRQGDRYFFAGRVEEVVSVGGHKVSPVEVELAALRIAGVSDARAHGVPNALLGQLVALEYVGEIEPTAVSQGLRTLLPKVAWPARIERVLEIPLTAAHKLSRRAE